MTEAAADRTPEPHGRPRWRPDFDSAAHALLMALVAAGLLAYALLLPASHWTYDEYWVGFHLAHEGWHAVIGRMRDWSPRPITEVLTALYLEAALRLHRPMITSGLATFWLASLAAVWFAGRRGSERVPALVAMLLMLLTLALAVPDGMFYWPLGCFAYLGCWTALAVVTLQLRAGSSSSAILVSGLLIAVGTLEIGAATVLIDAALALLLAVWIWPAGRRRRAVLGLVAPAAAAATVCVMVFRVRMRPMTEIMDHASGLAGHWLADFGSGAAIMLHEVVAFPGLPPGLAIPAKLALLLCLPPAATRLACGPRLRTVVWSGALLLGAYLSVVTALHQFGDNCCSRQASLRQGMILLAFASLLPAALPLRRLRQAGLIASLALLLTLQAPSLLFDLALVPKIVRARDLTWTSASGPGTSMVFHQPPLGRLVRGLGWTPGTADWEPGLSSPRYDAQGVAAFFGRERVIVLP